MREVLLLASNYSLFVAVLCVLAAVQASLWMHVFGFSPAPYLLLLVLTYWTLYRSVVEGVIMTYIAAFVLVSMSGIPLQMAFAASLSVYGFVYLMRDRVLWSGVNSFALACGTAAAILPAVVFVWSLILEDRPIGEFHFFEWLVRALLTAAAAVPLYNIFTFIDRLTHKESPKETESSVL